jgi:hypothetical protein
LSTCIDNKALKRLASDVRDQLEILIEMKDGQARQLRGGGNQDVGDRRGAVVTSVGKSGQYLDSPILD